MEKFIVGKMAAPGYFLRMPNEPSEAWCVELTKSLVKGLAVKTVPFAAKTIEILNAPTIVPGEYSF
jgi:hypothetical protein